MKKPNKRKLQAEGVIKPDSPKAKSLASDMPDEPRQQRSTKKEPPVTPDSDPSVIKHAVDEPSGFLSKINPNPNTFKIYAIIGSSTAIVIVTVLFLIIPQYSKIRNIKVNLAESKENLTAISAQAEYLENLSALQDELNKNIEVSKEAIPQNEDQIPQMLDALLQISESVGVSVVSQSLTGVTKTTSSDNPNQVRIQMSVQGDYSHILNFIKEVENSRNLMDVDSITFKKELVKDIVELDSGSEETVTTPKYVMEVSLVGYYMEDVKVEDVSIDVLLTDPKLEDTLSVLKEMKYYKPRESTTDVGKKNPFSQGGVSGIGQESGAE